jgi:Fe-S cluster assembly iron-binding protein IscA
VLTLTATAADAVRRLASAPPEGDAGLRISPGTPTATGTPLAAEMVSEPQPADQMISEDGAAVFVDEHLTAYLEDKVLDASIEANQVRFSLIDHEEASGA